MEHIRFFDAALQMVCLDYSLVRRQHFSLHIHCDNVNLKCKLQNLVLIIIIIIIIIAAAVVVVVVVIIKFI